MRERRATFEVEELSDADGLSRARRQRAQFDRNSAWLQAHIAEVYAKHRGKCICIAGEEVFAADKSSEAVARAIVAHPDDEGWFTRYIPREKAARI